eukprot:Gregarina_sp_Poly_1__1465@NODE_1367_length_4281_cov_300_263170_g915_i0_p1_GENE_NODE_1367_length_4281_cov_300_263170_g915_i0NODE_1367_length_4281_cov_300_263170_g915_i0_p1_ORF_typecomplete_len430_score72_71_NODE_1367_length_4281_cov_300_263170_g915_i014712760
MPAPLESKRHGVAAETRRSAGNLAETAASGEADSRDRLSLTVPKEFSPLHMRLLTCSGGGKNPSLAMRLEMELEYAERRAKCMKKTQHCQRWTDKPSPRLKGAAEGVPRRPVTDYAAAVSRHSSAVRTSRERIVYYQGGESKRSHRRVSSHDAASDDLSTCAGTGSLQSSGSPLSVVSASAPPEILPLTRCTPTRRVSRPRPRARPGLAQKDCLFCPEAVEQADEAVGRKTLRVTRPSPRRRQQLCCSAALPPEAAAAAPIRLQTAFVSRRKPLSSTFEDFLSSRFELSTKEVAERDISLQPFDRDTPGNRELSTATDLDRLTSLRSRVRRYRTRGSVHLLKDLVKRQARKIVRTNHSASLKKVLPTSGSADETESVETLFSRSLGHATFELTPEYHAVLRDTDVDTSPLIVTDTEDTDIELELDLDEY